MKEALARALPLFMVPTLKVVDHFPKLVNGKIDRQSLIRSYETTPVNFEYSDEDLEPLTGPGDSERARVILACIGQVTGERPRLADNFFAVGGTSINAMHALNKINTHYGLFGDNPVKISDFMGAKSILDLVVMRGEGATDEISIRRMNCQDEANVVETFTRQFHSTEILCTGRVL